VLLSDDYVTARRKADKSQYTSNLESEVEDVRHQQRNRKYVLSIYVI